VFYFFYFCSNYFLRSGHKRTRSAYSVFYYSRSMLTRILYNNLYSDIIFYLKTFSLSPVPTWERTDIYGEGNRLTFVCSLCKDAIFHNVVYIEVEVVIRVLWFRDH
jgi:hypothetical protein